MKNSIKYFCLGLVIIGISFTSCKDDDDDLPGVKVNEEFVVVANRGSSSISFIDVNTGKLVKTLEIPGSEPMYVVYVSAKDRLYVGDRAQNRIHIVDPKNKVVDGAIFAGNGVFHMWADALGQQLWVNNDIDNTISVIDLANNIVVQTISVDAKPHDVFVNRSGTIAYVSVFSGNSFTNDSIYHYSTNTFAKLGSKAVGKDPHMFHLENSNKLFVACQSGELYTLDGNDLNELSMISLTGAHGIYSSPDQNYVYVTNITGNEIYTINASNSTLQGSWENAIADAPHNIVLNSAGNRMYVTHSGPDSDIITTYFVNNGNISAGNSIATGVNPFGITSYKRLIQQ